MRRLYLIIIYMCLTLVVGRDNAQYYSVNYDKQIVAAMAAAFGAGAMAEMGRGGLVRKYVCLTLVVEGVEAQ